MYGSGERDIVAGNCETFRETVSQFLVQRYLEKEQEREKKTSHAPGRRRQKGAASARKKDVAVAVDDSSDPAPELGGETQPGELAEFIDYISDEIFSSLPTEVQTLTYTKLQESPALSKRYQIGRDGGDASSTSSPPDASTGDITGTLNSLTFLTPPEVTDSLVVYGFIPDTTDIHLVLHPILTDYLHSISSPPAWSQTRASACEICQRDWINLTYHHLIPRSVHTKVLKRGWHEEHILNSVAWLCGACHRFVHRMASNEELAREWFTVDRIMERDDAVAWAKWIGRVRYKAK